LAFGLLGATRPVDFGRRRPVIEQVFDRAGLRHLSGKLLGVRDRESEAFKAIKAFLADHKR
jgi:hypothetical protein